MRIEIDEKPLYFVITIHGDMNLTEARLLRTQIKELIEADKPRIVLDMHQVNSIDSAGVGILIACTTLLKRAMGGLAMHGVTRRVQKVLDITASSFFNTFKTEAEAEAYFRELDPFKANQADS